MWFLAPNGEIGRQTKTKGVKRKEKKKGRGEEGKRGEGKGRVGKGRERGKYRLQVLIFKHV